MIRQTPGPLEGEYFAVPFTLLPALQETVKWKRIEEIESRIMLGTRAKSPLIMLALAGVILSYSPAKGQAQSPAYTYRYWADKTGSYEAGGYVGQGTSRRYVKRKIRFLNIDYTGKYDQGSWRKAFLDAAVNEYKRRDVTFHQGRDGDFFTVGAISPTRQRIVGWFDDLTGDYGYAVITQVTQSRVSYTMNYGVSRDQPADPLNFLDFKLGYNAGDWDAGRDTYASIQLWHHTNSGTLAAVTFRLRSLPAR